MKFFDFKEGRLTPIVGDFDDYFYADKSTGNKCEWLLSENELRYISEGIEALLAEPSSGADGLPEWFALTVDSDLVSLGRHETYCDAYEATPMNTHWVFDEFALRSFQLEIENLQGEKP
jgi:hypothetical protein